MDKDIYEIKLDKMSRESLKDLCIRLLRNMECPHKDKRVCVESDCCTTCKLKFVI